LRRPRLHFSHKFRVLVFKFSCFVKIRSLAVKIARPHKSKDQALLVSVAESIGSTLGAIAAKADAAQKAFSSHKVTGEVKRAGRKLVRRGKRAASKLKKSKPVRVAPRTVRKAPRSIAARRRKAGK
jgi:hypothetical protein